MSRVDIWVGTRDSGPTASVPTRIELPRDAVREAIINAICHRDYTSNGSVQVMLFRDRLEIWNPGQLPQGLTTQKLYKPHKSKPRNLLIAKPMQRCGYIEKAGTGTGDIVKQCLDYGLKKPLFEQDGDFKVIIWRPIFNQVGPTSGLTQGPTSGLTLNDCQKLILEALSQGPQTTASLQELSGRTNRTKFKKTIIQPLLEAELIEPTHPQNMHHPQSGYKLKER